MRFSLLGPLEVRDDDGQPVALGGVRLRALLARLALDAGAVVTVETLIDALWDSDFPSGASNAVQSLVSRLRRALGAAGGRLVESRPGGYRLAVASDAVDVRCFERAAAEGRRFLATGDVDRAAELLSRALSLWRGPALSDLGGAPFVAAHAVRLEELRLGAVEDRAEACVRLGRHADVVAELEALVAAHPLRERLRGLLMTALYGTGRQAEALAVYEETRRVLAEELGIDPSPELEAVHLKVLRRDPELRGVSRPAPSSASPAPPQTNLRSQLTSFVGREEEVARLGKLLEDSRLVTLTGPGGSGKTRLAVEAAARLLDRMADGVWLVELAAVSDACDVPQAVLAVLGLREAGLLETGGTGGRVGSRDTTTRLIHALASRRLLLVLDNCEHLVTSVANFAEQVLTACPGVRILATSREPLAVPGEAQYPVPPLGVPVEATAPEAAFTYPAVRLFADRAAAVRPGFAVDARTLAPVTEICRRLDGLPLAIELAAARLRSLPVEEIAARLVDRFGFLTTGSRTADPRHQTLRAVVAWSWELLSEPEQVLARRLAVFAGDAALEAVEEICTGEALARDDMLDVLAGLVDKSLVEVADTPRARYRMLETIRAFAAERLAAAGEEERLRRAHARYFLRLAEQADPRLRTRDQLRWLNRLSTEHDNLHAALRSAIAAGDAETAVRLCAALGWYWWLSGHRADGVRLAETAVRLPGEAPASARAMAYLGCALNAFDGLRRVDQVRAWLDRAAELAERGPGEPDTARYPLLRLTGAFASLLSSSGGEPAARALIKSRFDDPDPWLRAMARLLHGHVGVNLGLPGSSEEDFRVALAGFRDLGERWGTAFAQMSLALLAAWRGESRVLIASLEEAIRVVGELGASEDILQLQALLGYHLWLAGERDRGAALLAAALRTAERGGLIETIAQLRYFHGEIARLSGDLAAATDWYEHAIATHRPDCDSAQLAALITSGLGSVAAAAGDLQAAHARHVAALRLARASRDAPVIAQVLVGFADLALRRGDPTLTLTLLGAGVTIRGVPDRSLRDAGYVEAAARAALGDQAAAEAYARGRQADADALLDQLEAN